MIVESFKLSEKKKAMLKIAILDEMLRLFKDKALCEISVDMLCFNINTTKVTFFKYFSYKEQVLDYFVSKWLYDRSAEIHNQKFQGENGLFHVFNSMCEDTILGQKIMVSLVNYYSKLKEKPPLIEITPYEYYLFNKEAFQQRIKPLELRQVFIYYLSGIKSIDPSKYNSIVCQLIALMYGVPIQTHIMGQYDMYPFYEIGIKNIIKSNKCNL